MTKIKVENSYIKIEGPVKIEVLEGELKIGGRVFKAKDSYLIPVGKSIVGFGYCLIEARLGSKANVLLLDKTTIPNDWKVALSELEKRSDTSKTCVVLVLGAVDTGKTTIISYLSNELLKKGYSVGVVDADIGQSDIGPPTTIALGLVREPFSMLYELKPESMYFVGSTSPKSYLLPMIVGTKKMVENANTDFVLIDTTGLIQFTGRALKTYKIEILKPDFIIALQRKDELEPILKPFEYINIIRLTVSEKANKKGIEARRFLRELSFKKYFEKCKEMELDLNDLKFLRSYVFTGEEIEYPNFLYTEKIPEGFVVVSDKYTKRPNTLTIQNGFEKNLLVGLMDLKNRVLGLGIIEFIDYKNKKIKILSPVEKDQIKIIIMGGIKIDKNGKEIEKIKPGSF